MCGSGCEYAWVDIYLNTRTLSSEGDFIRQKVAAHEFGHAQGLAHPAFWISNDSIMRQGSLPYNTPPQYDIDDINALYK